MLKKIITPTEELWLMRHACVSIKPGMPAKVRHITSYERRWRLTQAKMLDNPIKEPSDVERKAFWLIFNSQLRAVGGIK